MNNNDNRNRSYDLNNVPVGTRLVVTDPKAIRYYDLTLDDGDIVTTFMSTSNAGFRGIEVCVVDSQGRKFFNQTAGAFALAAR